MPAQRRKKRLGPRPLTTDHSDRLRPGMGWLNDGAVQGVVLGAGAVLVWALALYVGSRGPSRRAPLLAALAMLCLAAYLTGEALCAVAADAASWALSLA